MSFLLDTTAISELRRAERADGNVRKWFASTNLSLLFISVITLFELERGRLSLARRDPVQAAPLGDWLDNSIYPMFESRTLLVDDAVAFRCAALHVPRTRPLADSLIAATALVHDLVVVSRNEIDFLPMGVPLLNPWTLTSP